MSKVWMENDTKNILIQINQVELMCDSFVNILAYKVQNEVIKIAVEDYLKKNRAKIFKQIDLKSVVNEIRVKLVPELMKNTEFKSTVIK